jgi:hypothetical protein
MYDIAAHSGNLAPSPEQVQNAFNACATLAARDWTHKMQVMLRELTLLAPTAPLDPEIERVAETLARLIDDAPDDEDPESLRSRAHTARELIGAVTDVLILGRGYEPGELAPKIVLEVLRLLRR